MKPDTEKLLGTLELLCHSPFVWETDVQGEFRLWNLLNAESFVTLTDVELAFEHWQNLEHWGTATDPIDEYAPSRSERQDDYDWDEMIADDWNEAIATERQNLYSQLQQLLTSDFTNLQAYKLRILNSPARHSEFSVSILVAETPQSQWLCLTPTVPDQIGFRSRNWQPSPILDQSFSQLHTLIGQLSPISLCGYYYGGYNYTYSHQLIYSMATQKAAAIEQALKLAGMVTVRPLSDHDELNFPKLYQFITSTLQNCQAYHLCFWDIGYTYELGQATTGDWLGLRSMIEFEYNP